MINIFELLLNLIYPNVCGFCGKLNEDCLCEDCYKELNKTLLYREKIMQNRYFERLIYLSKYYGAFRKSILSYKFSDRPYIYKSFAKLILKNKKISEIIRKL